MGCNMASELTMPPLGEGIESADVLEVKVREGDTVKSGQILAVVQAEKVTAELEASEAGRVAKVLVHNGDTLRVGQPYLTLEAAEAKPEASPPKPEAESPKSAEGNGAKRQPESKPPTPDGFHAKPQAAAPKPQAAGEVVPAGPATRQLARRLGIDLRQVHGSGRSGRITQEDVEAYVRELASGAKPQAAGVVAAPELPDFARWGAVERRGLDLIRRRTAEQMHRAWTLIPHVTQHDLADITELDAFRKQQEARGPKLTVTTFVLKAVAVALRQFPQFNASLDLAGGALVLKQYYHLGVAVDTEHGLLVPVIRDVDKKSVLQLAGELTETAERARLRKLSADDMRGGTFTITNLGGIGGTSFTPIINWPEVAILGLSRARWEPTVRDGQVAPRLLLPLSLSYDHRVIDGADAARFTRRIAEMLENGWNMVMR
jgi:pyruvate dehydrogenase E2 component (dihydrolipoamide acetyltransferase)